MLLRNTWVVTLLSPSGMSEFCFADADSRTRQLDVCGYYLKWKPVAGAFNLGVKKITLSAM